MHQKYRECPSYRVRRGALVHGAELPGGVNQRTHGSETPRDVRRPRVQKRIKKIY